MRPEYKNALVLLAFLAAATPVAAADYGPLETYGDAAPELRGSYFEIGARYWYSSGQTDFDLNDSTGATLVSRLTYAGLDAHSGEIFFFSQHESGFLAKGYAGLGIIPPGSLNDEDFPPLTAPYSSTSSSQDDGDLGYFSIDAGYRFLDYYTGLGRIEVAGFTGYHYWQETVHAFGCTQVATNPAICVPAIAASTAVISEEVRWHAWRVGLMGRFDAGNGLKVSGEAAWVPYTRLDNTDHHHLRPDIDPTPSDGDGDGLQLEAALTYDVNERVSIGAGARYWRLGRTDGQAHFEQSPGGGVPQVIKFQSERYGAFVQASVKLY